jgi:site-specific recombinase XerC
MVAFPGSVVARHPPPGRIDRQRPVTWLQATQYLQGNLWQIANKKTGNDRDHRMLDTKVLSQAAIAEVLRFIDDKSMTASSARMRFVESVGLCPTALLGAKLQDLRLEPEGWVIQVHGKGTRNCIAALHGHALSALQTYLAHRGLCSLQHAPPETPLLASITDADALTAIGYQALYEHVHV